MSLEQFMPGGVKNRCSNCGKVLKTVRKLKNEKTGKEKPYCRECYYKKLKKPYDATHYTSKNFKIIREEEDDL